MTEAASPAVKLRMAFELSELAARIQHQNLRRRYPDESEDEIRERLENWLLKRNEPMDLPPGFRVRG